MNSAVCRLTLPQPAPARVLATGAFLKNTACLVQGREVWLSALHGDLSTPQACDALEASVDALLALADGPIAAVAHDLHPDFHSTSLALGLAGRLGVPAFAVQHHHAHAAVVQAELGLSGEPLLALALDGVGLGTDGHAWGGELLAVDDTDARRLDHLPWLPLPGGDVAAREPWRLAAAVLHRLGRAEEIDTRFAGALGTARTQLLRQMLDRGLHCPPTSSAGRWFDAAAGLLGLSVRQAQEAEAAMALERAASAWLEHHTLAPPSATEGLNLWPWMSTLCDETDAGRGAARFHAHLAQALTSATVAAATQEGVARIALVGGCFFNALLRDRVSQGLQAHGLQVCLPRQVSCGDAGLALGQAWAAAHRASAERALASPEPLTACTEV